ncbi:hypothetical protein ROHU_001380 [Labeo rohita]|uniref:Uncharacterized protein n=1 Tax=Labeo rohita TaxID=84645 RepID=A0A498P312_LABRO|nr:hypothetical protein ROHU_009891 [Labeo rohita]RXN38159.1 hypothetical protein ROHU_001380 [Labeo rohita]
MQMICRGYQLMWALRGSTGPSQTLTISVCAVTKGFQAVQNEVNVDGGDDLMQAQWEDPKLSILICLKQCPEDKDNKKQNTTKYKTNSVDEFLHIRLECKRK